MGLIAACRRGRAVRSFWLFVVASDLLVVGPLPRTYPPPTGGPPRANGAPSLRDRVHSSRVTLEYWYFSEYNPLVNRIPEVRRSARDGTPGAADVWALKLR
jgi:hypothetical protein